MQKRTKVLLILIGLLPVSMCVAAGIGAYQILPWRIPEILFSRKDGFAVLVYVRFPRVILSAVVGAMLAISGATLQGIFRNPLADPGLIGVTAGAGLGATLWIVPDRWRRIRCVGTSYRGIWMRSPCDYRRMENSRGTRKSSHADTIVGRHRA